MNGKVSPGVSYGFIYDCIRLGFYLSINEMMHSSMSMEYVFSSCKYMDCDVVQLPFIELAYSCSLRPLSIFFSFFERFVFVIFMVMFVNECFWVRYVNSYIETLIFLNYS